MSAAAFQVELRAAATSLPATAKAVIMNSRRPQNWLLEHRLGGAAAGRKDAECLKQEGRPCTLHGLHMPPQQSVSRQAGK